MRCCQSNPAMPKFAPITLFPSMLRGRPRQWNAWKNSKPHSGRVDARIGLETGRRDAGERALFVIIRGVARNADRPDDVAVRIANENAARHRHESAVARGCERGK